MIYTHNIFGIQGLRPWWRLTLSSEALIFDLTMQIFRPCKVTPQFPEMFN